MAELKLLQLPVGRVTRSYSNRFCHPSVGAFVPLDSGVMKRMFSASVDLCAPVDKKVKPGLAKLSLLLLESVLTYG